MPGAVELEIESVAYFSADRFRISFAVGAAGFTTIAYFSSLGLEVITIEAALDGYGMVPLLTGQIDNIQIDILENKAILTGRDLSARLIDTEVSETFVNQTASQIVTAVALRHQLTPNVTATAALVGQYYQLDHARTALGLNSRVMTEWNLLSALAEAENYELSVVGTVLNFGPPQPGVPVFFTPRRFMALSLDVAASLPGGTVVKSWNCRNKAVVTQSKGSGLVTTLVRPNLTQVQAQTLAAGHLANLARHATILFGTMPANLAMMPGMQITLGGTNSTFDQNYTITEILRLFDIKSGFLQTIRAYATS
ncbi:hypothetical protein GCM10010909_22430 [Acidocella aquatica]|uniref:Uncharacterized protein n=1 Tax=Acidocella aquatica TaxID=1922313 RepID=A0ABQ6A789_9PROT|nr:hypothetical protein [Acidocella aquatica]GLR67562.1 hypothetical protein GCM10010909_22430 [Acidocella aquatica]